MNDFQTLVDILRKNYNFTGEKPTIGSVFEFLEKASLVEYEKGMAKFIYVVSGYSWTEYLFSVPTMFKGVRSGDHGHFIVKKCSVVQQANN